MTQYILDTDHITLLQHSNPIILQRFETLHTSDVAITVINWNREGVWEIR